MVATKFLPETERIYQNTKEKMRNEDKSRTPKRDKKKQTHTERKEREN